MAIGLPTAVAVLAFHDHGTAVGDPGTDLEQILSRRVATIRSEKTNSHVDTGSMSNTEHIEFRGADGQELGAERNLAQYRVDAVVVVDVGLRRGEEARGRVDRSGRGSFGKKKILTFF